jgi:hypothetical protein
MKDRLLAFYTRRRGLIVMCTLIVCTVLALIARRPDQLLAPYIWVEDAGVNLPEYSRHGWLSLFYPVAGYFLLPNKVIFALSMSLSFLWLPEISYWLNIAFTIGVLAAIAFSPTQLRMRALCALSLLFLPIDSEVYAVSAYAFWWGSLLVVLPLLWREEGEPRSAWRIALLVIGGLSSPLIITLSPLYVLRALLRRNRAAYIDLGLTMLLAGAQVAALVANGYAKSEALSHADLYTFIHKFFGYFVYVRQQPTEHFFATGVMALTFLPALTVAAWHYRRALGPAFYWLLGAFLLASFASIARNWLSIIHPAEAGPRYFFLPFAFLAWAIAQFAALEARAAKLFAAVVLALALRGALEIGQRRHERMDWRAQIAQCTRVEGFQRIAFHFDGRAESVGYTQLLGPDCRRLVQRSWFGRVADAESCGP